jgi:Ca2+-binding RTX toxin-like protein
LTASRLLPFVLVLAGLVLLAPAAAAEGADRCGGPCTLVVKKLGSGGGVVRGSGGDRPIECGQACVTGTDYDERVVLTATPGADSVFTGWIGDCAPASGTSCTVHMVYGPITYYAVFDRAGDPPTPLQEPSSPLPPPPPAQPQQSEGGAPAGCTIVGTQGHDILAGPSARDVVCALAGNDHVHGGGGADVLRGGPGHDELEGNAGDDRAEGGRGHDLLDGGGGRDELRGGAGRDTLRGGSGADLIRARDGTTDTVRGGGGWDRAVVDGRDRLRGVELRR